MPKDKNIIDVDEDGIAVNKPDLVHADDIFKHGSKSVLRRLQPLLLAALCVSRLSWSRESARGASKKSMLSDLEREASETSWTP